jgi:hypothetical protein
MAAVFLSNSLRKHGFLSVLCGVKMAPLVVLDAPTARLQLEGLMCSRRLTDPPETARVRAGKGALSIGNRAFAARNQESSIHRARC